MLKFQYNGLKKSVWLIGPKMTLGTAKSNEIVLEGEGVATSHCYFYINNDVIEVEPIDNNPVYINEMLIKKRTVLKPQDITRVATQEFSIINPQSKAAILPTAPEPMSSESTVFRAIPSVVADASGWILQALHPNYRNKRYPIDGTMTLGRSPECELHFSFERLSRKHAELKLINGVLTVKDLDSSNGTFHNGEKITQAALKAGDTVAFDKLEFTVVAPTAVVPAGHEPDAMNQTVVRSAVTPDMMKQAKAKRDTAAPQPQASAAPSPSEKSNSNVILIAATVVVVVVIAIAVIVLL